MVVVVVNFHHSWHLDVSLHGEAASVVVQMVLLYAEPEVRFVE